MLYCFLYLDSFVTKANLIHSRYSLLEKAEVFQNFTANTRQLSMAIMHIVIVLNIRTLFLKITILFNC